MKKDSYNDYLVFFKESADMFFIVKKDGMILELNPSGRKLLGISANENINKYSLSEFFTDKSKWDETVYLMSLHGFVKDYTSELQIGKKNSINVSITASLEKNDIGDIVSIRGTIRNITERVKNEKLLTEAITKLVDANKKLSEAQTILIQQEKLASIGQLAAGVAHELNNPLGFISSNFNTLKDYIDNLIDYIKVSDVLINDNNEKLEDKICELKKDKDLDFILEDIVDIFKESLEGFDRIGAIIKSLREFSRIDYNNEFCEYDLNDSIKSTLTVAKNEIKYVADVELCFGKIPNVNCNGNEINQVLLNLIVNAAQAISKSENKERGIIKISTLSNSEFVTIIIEDNGVGIDDLIKNRIFDPFFTTKDVGKGTGLGLSISYDIIVNRHKGELFVEDGDKFGAKFIINLPIGN